MNRFSRVLAAVAIAAALSSGSVTASDKSKSVDDCRANYALAKSSETCRLVSVTMHYGKDNWCRITAACSYLDDTGKPQIQRTYTSERLDRVWRLRNCSGELRSGC